MRVIPLKSHFDPTVDTRYSLLDIDQNTAGT
jgi:hypothetical protein